MPPKKKPEPKRRQRRDPYQRAFEAAQKRLVRARAEQQRCIEKLQALVAEIPHLEEIVRVHGGLPATKQVHISEIGSFNSVEQMPIVERPGIRPEALKVVPPHLMRFIQPSMAGIGSIPNNTPPGAPQVADDDLPEPAGQELVE